MARANRTLVEANILVRLKSETEGQHRRLETRLDLLRLDFTFSEYARLLERFYGFYSVWEARATPILTAHAPDLYVGRLKTALLADDLAKLGQDLTVLPRCACIPATDTISQVLGSAYVLEGSTLGGQILCRHFSRTLGPQVKAMRFFEGYGQQTGVMWRAFCQEFIRLAEAAETEVVVASAQATFAKLENWLGKQTA